MARAVWGRPACAGAVTSCRGVICCLCGGSDHAQSSYTSANARQQHVQSQRHGLTLQVFTHTHSVWFNAFFRFKMLRTKFNPLLYSAQLASLWQHRSAQLQSQLSPWRVSLRHLALLLLTELGLSRTQELLPSPGGHQQIPDWMEEARKHHQLCGLWRHSKVSFESESTACTISSQIISYSTAA